AHASHAAAARCRRTRSSDGSVGLLPEGDRQGPEHLAVLHLLLSCPDQLSSILGGEPGLRLQHLADPSGGHSKVSRHERSGRPPYSPTGTRISRLTTPSSPASRRYRSRESETSLAVSSS